MIGVNGAHEERAVLDVVFGYRWVGRTKVCAEATAVGTPPAAGVDADLKPQRLRLGDTIGIVSPSWYDPYTAHRVERGSEHMRSLGFEVKVAPHALNKINSWLSDTPENRAADIHAMFSDPEVKAVVASIGGDHSCQILTHLDWDLLRSNPKIFMGYSDITVLNVAIWQMIGLGTFSGPTLITEWAEYPRMPEYTEHYVLKALCEPEPVGVIEPAEWWTDEFLDWEAKQDLTRPRERRQPEGRLWVRGGRAEGVLVGGAIESFQHLRGTHYWPEWDGVIFCAELVGEVTDLETADGILMDYENMGVFDRLGALVFGRPSGYTSEQRQQLRDIVRERTKGYDFPVVTDMDFGHTSPMFTIPIGRRALIDGDEERFEIVEAAVS